MYQRIATVALCLALTAATARFVPAAPIVISTVTDLGDGLFAYDLSIDGQDNEYRSFFAQSITFNGNLIGFGNWVDPADPMASFVYSPWTENRMGAPIQSVGSYAFSAGTGGGSRYLNLPLARVVVAGDLIVAGGIGRGGLLYEFSGSFSSTQSSATIESVHDVPDYLQPKTDPSPPPEPEVVLPVGPIEPPSEPVTIPELPASVELPLAPEPPLPPEVMPEPPAPEPPVDWSPIFWPIVGPDERVVIAPGVGIPMLTGNPDSPFYPGDLVTPLPLLLQPPTTFDAEIQIYGDGHRLDSVFAASSSDIVVYRSFNDLATPEPATWLLAILGAAILAAAGGSRRRG